MVLLGAGTLLVTLLAFHLTLLRGLGHCIENTEIVLGVLKIGFGENTITSACRVATKLQILLKKLLGRTAHTHIRAIAVEHVVTVQGRLAI